MARLKTHVLWLCERVDSLYYNLLEARVCSWKVGCWMDLLLKGFTAILEQAVYMLVTGRQSTCLTGLGSLHVGQGYAVYMLDRVRRSICWSGVGSLYIGQG